MTTIVLPLLGTVVGRVGGASVVSGVLFVLGLVAPLVTGIVLTAQRGSPPRRGLGLGLIIGWALAPIIFAGVCLIILIGAYSQTGS